MQYLDFFIWWAITISGGIAFLILVSIYLYAKSKTRRTENSSKKSSRFRVGKDFVFVLVLVALLIFYIISVYIGSSLIFAAGNIIVEAILIVYLIKNRHEKSEQTEQTEQTLRPRSQ